MKNPNHVNSFKKEEIKIKAVEKKEDIIESKIKVKNILKKNKLFK